MKQRTTRRHVVGAALGAGIARAGLGAAPRAPAPVTVSVAETPDPVPFDRRQAGFTGIYDVDWLHAPEYAALLDNLAASPGAFHGVRFFGCFTAGQREDLMPRGGGRVWTDPEGPIDFTLPFRALEALTSRGLTPFVVLGFFPPAVSPSPIQPPATWARWRRLVRAFFEALAADPRFGERAIRTWWFEPWNEPNEGRFWSGTEAQYHALYRATSEAIAETGLPVRLGGPAIAYKPQASPDDGPPWMERFLRFIAADPALRLTFISLHRKGTVGDDPPDPRRLHEAAATTARQALAIDAARFAGVPIVNDEADEKVGFEVPYAPRLNEQGAAWLAATTAIHAGLDRQHRADGVRFLAAADNANLHLVREPFDGRRSIMVPVSARRTDLVKLPAYGFYELLRLLGGRQGQVVAGGDRVFPASDTYQLVTRAATHVAALLTVYPHPDGDRTTTREIDYRIEGIPWPRVNVACFRIDRTHGNAWTVAGGSTAHPFPTPPPTAIPQVRRAQEVALARPLARGVRVAGGVYRERIALAPYATVVLWITPVDAWTPPAPSWVRGQARDGNVVVRWEPSAAAWFFSYEVFLMAGDEPGARLSPEPLRSALWVDTAPPPGPRRYGVRTVSASGVAGPLTVSAAVLVEGRGHGKGTTTT